MANIDVPAPGSSLLFFVCITLGFTIFTLFSIQNAKSIESIEKAKDSSMLNLIYISILVIGSYFINTTVSKALCNSQSVQWSNILIATMVPWLVIFFSLYVLLKIFPGWITPFSNTIGYLIISMLGVEKTLKDILNDKVDADPTLVRAIANINHNKSNFINQIDVETTKFTSFIDELVASNIIDLTKGDELKEKEAADKIRPGTEPRGPEATPVTEARGAEARGQEATPVTEARGTEATPVTEPRGAEAKSPHGGSIKAQIRRTARNSLNKQQRGGDPPTKPDVSVNAYIIKLYRLLVIKNAIGQIAWYTLAGTLVSSVSYNYIINMSCNKSLDEIANELKNAELTARDEATG